MELNRIQDLIPKYLEGKASDEERDEVEQWYAMIQQDKDQSKTIEMPTDTAYEQVLKRVSVPERSKRPAVYRIGVWAAAAAAIIIVSLLLWPSIRGKYLGKGGEKDLYTSAGHPKINNAVLALSNGRWIDLDQAPAGPAEPLKDLQMSIGRNQLKIIKNFSAKSGSNTLSIPSRRTYNLRLPDGTLAVLNAGSSISFPNNFDQKSRIVEITGEVYFDVSHKKREHSLEALPFIVKAKQQIITVLGTRFDVNAYGDGSGVTTTLLRGSVNVSYKNKNIVLNPGESVALKDGDLNLDRTADLERNLGWRNEQFIFKRSTVEEILNDFSHWYGLEIIYATKPSGETFSGKVPRNVDIDQALQIIAQKDLRFRVSGKKVYVEPNP